MCATVALRKKYAPDIKEQCKHTPPGLKKPVQEQRRPWGIQVSPSFENCEKIHPLQQKKVRKIIDSLSTDSNVLSITIFGSSVRGDCHAGSDVDIYLILKKEDKVHLNCTDFVYDLWTNFTVDSRMLKEILKKGVRVYARRNITGQSYKELQCGCHD